MNQVIELPKQSIVPTGRMAVAEVVQHAMVVQEVMQAVMKPGLHYGKVPGTDKPTLFKAGAEKLCMVFKIGDDYRMEDLSTPDVVRYRITCVGIHTPSGAVLGQGVGECSGSEEKYKWRKAVCDEEFDSTPQHLRREKFGKAKGGGFYKQKQVRTEPSDLANTVLKMAAKRAKLAMVLNVLAVSDMFNQDLEDLDDTLREHLTDDDGQAPAAQAQPTEPQQWPDDKFAEQMVRWTKAVGAGLKSTDDILALARSKGALTAGQEAQIRAIPPAAAKEPAKGGADAGPTFGDYVPPQEATTGEPA